MSGLSKAITTANPTAASTINTKLEIHHWYSRSFRINSRAMIVAETRSEPASVSPDPHR